MKAVQKITGRPGHRQHRAVIALVMTVGLLALWVPLATPGNAQEPPPQHGIAFLKGCQSPRSVGQKTLCDFSIVNSIDPDTLTITSIVDVVHSSPTDDSTGNILADLQFEFTGGAHCNDTDPVPTIPRTVCTLPPGSSISTTTPFAFHTITGADAANANPLVDEAQLTWQDTCDSQAPNCP